MEPLSVRYTVLRGRNSGRDLLVGAHLAPLVRGARLVVPPSSSREILSRRGQHSRL